MYSSSFVSKHHVLVPTVAVVTIQLLLIRSVSSINMTNSYLQHKCFPSQGKYKPGSVYDKHLKDIINTTTMNDVGNFAVGFEMMSVQDGPDLVFLLLQCRGDSYGPKCRSCYLTALTGLRRKCPNYKGRIIWYDQCFVEISTMDTLGKIDYDNNFCMSNPKEVTGDKDSFDLTWRSLIDNLTGIATTGDNNVKGKEIEFYAAGERKFGTKKIYAMVQCTKDLSIKGCQVCMGYMMIKFNDCYYDKQGARVFGRSCGFRFELYPFVTTKGHKYLKT